MFFSLSIGVPLGLLSGYVGGKLDRGLVLVMDALFAFPYLLLAIVIAFLLSDKLGQGIITAAVAITIVYIPQYFRVVRNHVISVREEPYVEAARALGAKRRTIIGRYVFFNVIQNVPVVATLNAADAILTLAALGFLGYGIQPTQAAEWGYDVQRAISDAGAGIWWTGLFPGLAIVLLVTGFTLVGEGLNDILNPLIRYRRVRKPEIPGASPEADEMSARRPRRPRPPRLVRHRGRPGARRGRGLVRDPLRRDARTRRRVGLRQVHARQGDPRAVAGGRRHRRRDPVSRPRTSSTAPPKEVRALRGPELGLIFQEPMTRLDPLMTIEDHFVETLKAHEPDTKEKEMRRRSLDALGAMGIPPTRFKQYPHEFSGGMRQRIMIALALVLNPKVVVADEPTTALDVIVEGQILEILADLRRNFDTSLLLITHNLGIVAEACDRVAVMYAGRIVEQGDAREVFAEPAHPYTRELLRVDDLAGDDRPAVHPRRAAEPDRPAARMPFPPALPERDAGVPDEGPDRGRRSRRGPASPSAGCTDPGDEIPAGGDQPLEREEIAVAEEA